MVWKMENKTLSKQQVSRIAQIARLAPNNQQLESLTNDANNILEYFSLIDEIPKGVQPRQYVHGFPNRPRCDNPAGGQSDPLSIRKGFAKEQDGFLQAQKSL